MMSVRIFDIIATNPGDELTSSIKITKNNVSLYKPSNLGGGYSRDESGRFVPNNESITFDFIFKTDINSTGYEKYLQTVSDMSEKRMVWLRYAVPINSNQYTYAYRPGFVSEITKTEASNNQGSMIEQITIQTVGSWFKLYKFTQSGAARSLATSSASTTTSSAIFSNYPDDFKAIPYAFPYWYQSIVEELIRKRENGSNSKNGSWYDRWGNVLDPNSQVYQMFAIHAPNSSISEIERVSLGEYNTSTALAQSERIKGNSYASKDFEYNDPELEGEIQSTFTAIQNSLKNKRSEKSKNFKASLVNYSVQSDTLFNGEYDSYLLIGSCYSPGGKVTIATTANSITNSELSFNTTGSFIIDTASWANIYSLNGSSGGINFSKFFKTTANGNEKLLTTNVTLNTIIMRRGVLGV